MLANSCSGIMSSFSTCHIQVQRAHTCFYNQPFVLAPVRKNWSDLTGQVMVGRQKLPAAPGYLPFTYQVALGPIYRLLLLGRRLDLQPLHDSALPFFLFSHPLQKSPLNCCPGSPGCSYWSILLEGGAWPGSAVWTTWCP